jgi:hypothetical protein
MSLHLHKNQVAITDIGGIAIKLTNKTGSSSVKGEVVKPNAALANSIVKNGISGTEAIGVFLDSDIADGSEAWIVVTGIAEVRADAAGFSIGDRLIASSATTGRAETNNSPANTVHFTEIGHTLENAAANALGKCALHFN